MKECLGLVKVNGFVARVLLLMLVLLNYINFIMKE